MSRWGKERVTEFIDHVLRIETLIDSSKAWERKKIKNPIIKDHRKYHHPSRLKIEEGHDYMNDYLNPKEWIDDQKEKINKVEVAEYLDIFSSPTKDIMRFIRDNAPLKTWEADIVAMLYDESMYFAPQRLTKTSNEGWACVAPNTLISTKHGFLTAKNIIDKKIESEVFDGVSHKKITNWFKFENRNMISVETNRGYKLTGSENHRVYDKNLNWNRMDDLKVGKEIALSKTNIWSENYCAVEYSPVQRLDSKTIKNILGKKYWKYN
jgi:spore cortex formation protein SpoVR/YcgB (stage V sporulation)